MKRLAPALLLVAACAPAPARFDVEPLLAAADAHRADDRMLAEATKSPVAGERAAAAVAYGRILTPECLMPLFVLTVDPEAVVRRQAAFALGQYGWKPETSGSQEGEILARLESLLIDRDRAVRLAAIEAVGKVAMARGPEILLPKLNDTDPAIRAEIVMALFRARFVQRMRNPKAPWPESQQTVIDKLRELTHDSDPLVRRNVAFYFARVKDVRGVQSVKLLAKDPSPDVRFFAAVALGRSGEVSAAEALVPQLSDGEYLVRVAAVQALGSLKLAAMIGSPIAKDPSFHVRAAYADAVGTCDCDDSVLDGFLSDERFAVRCAAIKALAKRRKETAAPVIETLLKNADWRIRAATVEAVASVEGWSRVETVLSEALKDPDERVAASAVEAFGTRETPGAFEAIKEALKSELVAVRGTAVEILKGRKEAEAVAEARACYDRSMDRKWIELREGLVDLFAEKQGEPASAALYKALSDPAASVAIKARKALEAAGARSLPPVVPPATTVSPFLRDRFKRNPVVVLETSRGTMEIECLAAEAPVHVANFVGLARKGFYDGLIWHRVVPAFVIQGGDPLGNGSGDPGWSLRAEINPVRYERGSLGMPRSDHFDTGGCQLFFTHLATPHLDGNYTVFGRVRKGLEVIDEIEVGDKILKATVRD